MNGAGVYPDNFLDLPLYLFDIRVWQVNLVKNGYDFKIVINGQIGVGQCLRFHALGGVHDQ